MTIPPNEQPALDDEVRLRLERAFDPGFLEIHDDSARHASHSEALKQGGGHLIVHIVSEAFEGLSRLERHRKVYGALGSLMGTRIHALALTAFTPAEHDCV